MRTSIESELQRDQFISQTKNLLKPIQRVRLGASVLLIKSESLIHKEATQEKQSIDVYEVFYVLCAFTNKKTKKKRKAWRSDLKKKTFKITSKAISVRS
jgi:hypothetical protein